MDGQPLLLLFSVHVVYQFPPLAGAENRLLSSRLALRRVLIAGLLYGGIRLSPGLMNPEARFDSARCDTFI